MDLYLAYLRLLIAFPLVMILAYWGLRFLLQRFAPVWSMEKRIQVVERTALHTRAFLYVVKMGEDYFLLAATPSSVTFLKDLGRAWQEESLLTETGNSHRGLDSLTGGGFAGLLEKLRLKGNQRKGPGGRG